MRHRPLIALVTDRRRFGAHEEVACDRLVRMAGLAAQAGVDLIQVRERGLHDRDLLVLVRRIVQAASATAARVLVNERADVALAAGAAGVHLRALSPGASDVRVVVPCPFLIGRSVHDLQAAMAAEREGGCDYLLFGTVFPSTSKPPGHPVAGVAALQQVCGGVRLPVLAIGGITPERVGAAVRAGAAGIAGIELFAERAAGSDSPAREQEAAERLRALVHGIRDAFHAARD